jgi:hypothetical protein
MSADNRPTMTEVVETLRVLVNELQTSEVENIIASNIPDDSGRFFWSRYFFSDVRLHLIDANCISNAR